MSPTEIASELGAIALQLVNGCGNNGCRIKQPSGMATNGGCQCSPLRLSKRLLDLAREARKAQQEGGAK